MWTWATKIDSNLAASALGSIATAVAAFFAWRAVVATQRAAEGQLILGLLGEYSGKEMCNALRALGAWGNKYGISPESAKAWQAARDDGDVAAVVFDAERRLSLSCQAARQAIDARGLRVKGNRYLPSDHPST